MRLKDVIPYMLTLHRQLAGLPKPRACGFYTGTELAEVIGRTPCHTDAQCLRHLGWFRIPRVVNGKLARVWVPPTHASALLDSKPT